jgi:hypothetical protein
MSDILASMAAYLALNADVTALAGTRIYPMRAPAPSTKEPNTLPYLTFQLIDEPVAITHDAKSTYKARVQVDARAETYKAAHALADAVHAALHGYRGNWSPFDVGSVLRKSKADLSDMEVGLERLSQDYVVTYREE